MDSDDTLDPYLLELAEWKQKKNEAEAKVKSLTAHLTQALQDREIRKLRTEGPDGILTGTLVTPSVVEVDEARLKRKIGAKVWHKLTREVLDKSKLDDALATGLVDIADVALCSSEVPRSPYIKISVKKAADK